MANTLSPIIQATELLKFYKNDNLVLIDASNSKEAKSNYLNQHLEGAIFIDINTQLADIKDDFSNGGRHPLPLIEKFIFVLNQIGISPNHHIVIYDTFNGYNAAARLWWMLKSVGHVNVQILNGGFKEAIKVGIPVNSEIKKLNQTQSYKAQNWLLMVANIEEVEDSSNNNSKTIIDVREKKRFYGEIEPIDLIAGHIPNAINIPFTENLNSEGLFLSPSILKEMYLQKLNNKKSDEIIVHCGSGVTACFTLLAMDYAGLEIPKLYVGSWSEWSRNNKPIATNI
jgi:thiosulfate/3-mercaptopyruvate sulfurtransferase